MNIKHLIVILSLLVVTVAKAQLNTNELKGNEFIENFLFSEAIKAYEKVPEGSLSTKGLRNLAKAYKRTNNLIEAEAKYALLNDICTRNSEDLFDYAQVLAMNGKHDESALWMTKFNKRSAEDSRGKYNVSKSGAYERIASDLGRFSLFAININSKQSDFSPTFYNNEVLFTSARKNNKPMKRVWSGTNESYLNLYSAQVDATKQLFDVQMMGKTVNKKFHQGVTSFSQDGGMMVITRTNYEKKSSDGARKLAMYYREKNENGEWKRFKSFPFNDPEYNVGQPSISADGQTIYFTSDMKGSKGATDVYYSTKTNEGWSAPIAVGGLINTEGKEMFPFVHEDSLLFFASNGHVGLGGLDIFVGNLEGGSVNNITNLGAPINSTKDDFGFILDAAKTYGYFSSNREGGKGGDDIYGFHLTKPLSLCNQLDGKTMTTEGEAIARASVKLTNTETDVIETWKTGVEGDFVFCVEPGTYNLSASKQRFYKKAEDLTITESMKLTTRDFVLKDAPLYSLLIHVTDQNKVDLEGAEVTYLDRVTRKDTLRLTDTSGVSIYGLLGKWRHECIFYSVIVEKEGYLPEVLNFNRKLKGYGEQVFEVILKKRALVK